MELKTNLTMQHFIPKNVWISSSLSNQQNMILIEIQQILPGIGITSKFGDTKTLHVGTKYEVVSNLGQKIIFITPNVLKDLIRQNKFQFYLPANTTHCVSLCLTSIKVSVYSIPKEDIVKISKMTTLLGGEFVTLNHPNLVDVLITTSPIPSSKVSNFIDQIQFVTIDWLLKCYEKLELVPYTDFLIPRFSSLEFSSSDLDPSYSERMKQLIDKNGGKYADSLSDTTNILIASKLSMTKKIKLALKLSIPIVKPEWVIHQSLQMTPISSFVLNFWCLKKYKTNLFENFSFAIHSECSEFIDILTEAIKFNSGKFDDNPNIYIVPNLYNIGHNQVRYVTPIWVWRCISDQKLISEQSSIVYKPFNYTMPSESFNGYVIALCKLDEIRKFELSEGLRTLGFSVHFKATRAANIIVTEALDGSLTKKAKKFNIEIVSPKWVIEIFKTNKLPPTKKYSFGVLENNTNVVDALYQKIKENDQSKKLTKDICLIDLDNFSQNEPKEKSSSPPRVKYDMNYDKQDIKVPIYFEKDPLLQALSSL